MSFSPFASGLKLMEAYGVSAQELRLVGGGSKNQLWRRIIADSFQLPIRFPVEPESAALGGALQAAAVYNQEPVADYITAHEPGTTDEVGHLILMQTLSLLVALLFGPMCHPLSVTVHLHGRVRASRS